MKYFKIQDMNIPTNRLNFIEKVGESLDSSNFSYVLALFNDNQYFEDLKNSCWDLLPLLSKHLTSKLEEDNINNFKDCERLINKLAENCNPEEALLQFIEEVEESEDDTQFVALLCPMLKVLQRIPKNRLNSLAWCLNSIQTYFNKIDVSENCYEKSVESKKLSRIEMLYQNVILFYDLVIPFYSENLKSNKDFGVVLSKHLIELLGNPLGYLDTSDSEKKSKIRTITETIVEKIFSVCGDPFSLFNLEKSCFLMPTDFSYGIFLYLLKSEMIKEEMIPKVYAHCYIFHSSLTYVVPVLKTDTQLVIAKGLHLVESLLQNNFKLSYLVLELEINKEFVGVLENIIVYNESEEFRKQGFRIFKLYLDSFEVQGQYLLLYNLVHALKHSGLTGFVITQYKEILVKLEKTRSTDLHYFQGNKLYSFIKQCCVITKEDEYNLINAADKIVSVLNLMRFVVLQERTKNFGSFSEIVIIWKDTYFDPLYALLQESKKSFKEQKYEIEQGINVNLNLSVVGHSVLEMPRTEKLKAIELSMTGLNMMESLLNRLLELLEIKNCND